jgi:hypothetical protein
MDNVLCKNQWDSESGFLSGNALHFSPFLGSPAIEERAPAALPDLVSDFARQFLREGGLRHLPELLFERHPAQERLYTAFNVRLLGRTRRSVATLRYGRKWAGEQDVQADHCGQAAQSALIGSLLHATFSLCCVTISTREELRYESNLCAPRQARAYATAATAGM